MTKSQGTLVRAAGVARPYGGCGTFKHPGTGGEPVGLVGGDACELVTWIQQRRGPMGFWRPADLRLLGKLDELRAAADRQTASSATHDAAEASHECP